MLSTVAERINVVNERARQIVEDASDHLREQAHRLGEDVEPDNNHANPSWGATSDRGGAAAAGRGPTGRSGRTKMGAINPQRGRR